MNYDPNSDQEKQINPEEATELTDHSQSPSSESEAPVFEDQTVSQEEMPQEPGFSGAFANHTPEEEWVPDTLYRGRFSAHPAEEAPEGSEPEQPDSVEFQEPDTLNQPEIPSEEVPYPAQEQQYPETEYPSEPAETGFPDAYGEVPPQEPIPPYPSAYEEEKPPVPSGPEHPRRRAIKKGRPRRNKGEGLFGIPNLLATGVWIALTLLISVTLGRMIWVCAAEVLAFGREDKSVTITVYETDTIDDITKKLARAELIHYPGLFKLYAQFAVDDGDIHPGMWDLNTKYDYHALVKMMSPSSSRSTVKVMIPEGYSCRQIFALLEENKVCTVQDIASYAAYGELNDYWFLEGVARGDKYCLEGFLFPDTYEFYQNDTPKSVLTKMLNNFDNRFDEDMRGKIQTLNAHLADLMRRDGKTQDYIDSHLFTVRDVVNVASMIEKETSSAQEGYTIASVIYNRLFCWQGNPAYLNIDATIIYALDGKTDLTAEDMRVNSPYNTYLNIGLTPGPISNPGLSSLRAALEPADTNYYYYVLDPTAGSHVFATTLAEHEANLARLGG